jgi:phage terminase small subunit
MQIKLFDGLIEGLSIKDAALAAGYSPTNATSALYSQLKSKALASKMGEYIKQLPTARRNLALMRLPRLSKIEETILEKAEGDPEYALRASKTIEREYKIAGILQDEVHGPATVQIQTLNVIQQALQVHYTDTTEVIDAK